MFKNGSYKGGVWADSFNDTNEFAPTQESILLNLTTVMLGVKAM